MARRTITHAEVGPHFAAGQTNIGRKRLPPGIVAIFDSAQLRGAIRELHLYAAQNREPDRPRVGIVFRVVESWEQSAIVQKLHNLYSRRRATELESEFAVRIGHLHLMDDSLMSHACNRHAITEGAHSHLLLTLQDFETIPEVVDPRNIVEFSVTRGMPRMVYRKLCGSSSELVVVQEIQANTGLAIKTAYRKR